MQHLPCLHQALHIPMHPSNQSLTRLLQKEKKDKNRTLKSAFRFEDIEWALVPWGMVRMEKDINEQMRGQGLGYDV